MNTDKLVAAMFEDVRTPTADIAQTNNYQKNLTVYIAKLVGLNPNSIQVEGFGSTFLLGSGNDYDFLVWWPDTAGVIMHQPYYKSLEDDGWKRSLVQYAVTDNKFEFESYRRCKFNIIICNSREIFDKYLLAFNLTKTLAGAGVKMTKLTRAIISNAIVHEVSMEDSYLYSLKAVHNQLNGGHEAIDL